ncbi:MAG: helical backbone metal receptor [Flavobacteriales bacterium]|nr:helical backbone metal receptor [Flavobacteriales bacterium]
MPRYQKIISLSSSVTETLLALGAEEKITASVEQNTTHYPLYATLPKVKSAQNISLKEIKDLFPDVIMVAEYEKNLPIVSQAEKEGIAVETLAGDTIAEVEDTIYRFASMVGRSTEAEKLITRIEYGFSVVKEQTKDLDPIRTAFFCNKDPYVVASGKGLLTELLAVNNMENVYSDIDKKTAEVDLSTLKILDPHLILLPSYPVKMTDDDAFTMGQHTEHALTVFVPGEYFSAGADMASLGEFYNKLNEKMRRFSSDNLANRGEPTYF